MRSLIETPVRHYGLHLDRWRLVLAVAGLAMAGVSLAVFFSWRSRHNSVIKLMEDTGLPVSQPEVAEGIRREPDPVRAKLALARALVVQAVDFEGMAKLTPAQVAEEVMKSGERLDLAEKLASDVIGKRPTAWEAPMVLGAARYFKLARSADPRLFEDRGSWEKPLLKSMTLAPSEDEPVRFLARAKLETWPALNTEEQRQARDLLKRAFSDSETFARLAPLWLATAGSPDEIFALIPETTEAWRVVREAYRRSGNWALYCTSHRKYLDALARELNSGLGEIEKLIRGGDPSAAFQLVYDLVIKTPVMGVFSQSIEQVLRISPPGLPPRNAHKVLRSWLKWNEDRFILGQQGMDAAVIRRMAGGLDDLEPWESALAAAIVGEREVAEVFERREGALNTERWAPYCIAKTHMLLGRREFSEAHRLIFGLQREWRDGPLVAWLRLQIAEMEQDPLALVQAQEDLNRHNQGGWPSTGWRWNGRMPWRDIYLGKAAKSFELTFTEVPAAGAVVSVVLDGDEVKVAAVEKGLRIAVPVAIDVGVHRVALTTLAGSRAVIPGELILAY